MVFIQRWVLAQVEGVTISTVILSSGGEARLWGKTLFFLAGKPLSARDTNRS
jgi:hypothetical protein